MQCITYHLNMPGMMIRDMLGAIFICIEGSTGLIPFCAHLAHLRHGQALRPNLRPMENPPFSQRRSERMDMTLLKSILLILPGTRSELIPIRVHRLSFQVNPGYGILILKPKGPRTGVMEHLTNKDNSASDRVLLTCAYHLMRVM